MDIKLNKVMFVEDDPATSFYNRKIIARSEITDKIISFVNGVSAARYIKTFTDDPSALPDLIFLDINMPGMDGWGFLDEVSSYGDIVLQRLTVFMLSSSEEPEDIDRIDEYPFVRGYIRKPLRQDDIYSSVKGMIN